MAEELNIENLLASILGTDMGSEGGGPGNWLQPHIPNPDFNPNNPDDPENPPTIANPEFGNLPGDTPTDFGTGAGLPAWSGWHGNPYNLGEGVHSDYVKGHALSAGAQEASSKNQAQAQMIRALIEPYISEQMRAKRELATAEKGGEISKALEQTKGEQARQTQAAAASSELDKLLGQMVTTENEDGTTTTSRQGGTMGFERDTAKQLEELKGQNTLDQIMKQASEGRATMDHHSGLLENRTGKVADMLDQRFGGGGYDSIPFGNVFSGLMGGGAGGAGGAAGTAGAGSGITGMGGTAGHGMAQTAAMNTMAGFNPYTAAAGNVANIAGAGATGPNALSALGAGFQGQSMANLNAANMYGGDVKTAAGALGSQLGQQYSNIGQVMRPGATAMGTTMGNVAGAYGKNIANQMNFGIG